MVCRRYSIGRYKGDNTESFTYYKTYRGKFDVYKTFILFAYQSRVYRASPDMWEFEDKWEVK